MNVSVVIPTRGDVDMAPVTESFPPEWEVLTYDNGAGVVRTWKGAKWGVVADGLPDLSVYARYACIECASHDLILTQDDDVIVSDPQAIVAAWADLAICNGPRDCVGTDRGCVRCYPSIQDDHVICNQPPEFRHDGYTDSALVGFGACFHRDAPNIAFGKFWQAEGWASHALAGLNNIGEEQKEMFLRTCDVVFTTLTPRFLVDVPKQDREFASDPNRMWKQKNHLSERTRMLDLARRVRDA